MRLRSLLVGTALLSALFVPNAGAGPDGWSVFSTKPVVNFADPALHRTSDGVLHVLWVQDDDDNAEDLFQTTIAPDGTVAPASAILTDWASMWSGGGDLAPTSDGKLRYFFGGLRTTTTGDDNSNMSMLTSDASGTSWTLHSEDVVAGRYGAAYASTVGAAAALDGTPFQVFGSSVHRGTDPDTPTVRLQEEIGGGCCAYDPDVATDQVTGQMYVAWYSNADEKYGLWVHEIDPSNAEPVGEPMLMPDVTEATEEGGQRYSSPADTRAQITGRTGKPGVYVAHTGGYPFTKKVLVWKVGEDHSTAVVSTSELRSHSDPAIAADPQGRLWVAWSRSDLLYFRRSNPDADTWGRVVTLRVPNDTSAIYDVKINAQESVLDVIALFDSDTGSPMLWHTQVYPGMSMGASRRSFRREATIDFTMTDAGAPIGGVQIGGGGVSATTNAAGKASLHLGPYKKAQTITITAKKEGFKTAKLKVKAKV